MAGSRKDTRGPPWRTLAKVCAANTLSHAVKMNFLQNITNFLFGFLLGGAIFLAGVKIALTAGGMISLIIMAACGIILLKKYQQPKGLRIFAWGLIISSAATAIILLAGAGIIYAALQQIVH